MGRTEIKKNNTGKGKGKSLAALKRKQFYFGGANIDVTKFLDKKANTATTAADKRLAKKLKGEATRAAKAAADKRAATDRAALALSASQLAAKNKATRDAAAASNKALADRKAAQAAAAKAARDRAAQAAVAKAKAKANPKDVANTNMNMNVSDSAAPAPRAATASPRAATAATAATASPRAATAATAATAFDSEAYIALYPDLQAHAAANPNWNAERHYANHGQYENRDSGQGADYNAISTGQTRSTESEAAKKARLLKEVETGQAVADAKRRTTEAPRANVVRTDTEGTMFNAEAYMAANLDLQQYARDNPDFDPYQHYLDYGADEIAKGLYGRKFGTAPTVTGKEDIQKISDSSTFNEASYMAANPDLVVYARTHPEFDPYAHYINYGIGEGREGGTRAVKADTVTAKGGTTATGTAKQGKKADDITANTYDADLAEDLDPTKAAKGNVSRDGEATEATLTERAGTGTLTAEEIEAAQAQEAAKRPDSKDYATAARDDGPAITVEDVTGPDVDTRTGVVISDEKVAELTALAVERGLDPAIAIQNFKDAAATRTAQTGTAAEGIYTPRLGEAPEETAARAETYGADYTPQGGNTEIDATPAYTKAASRTAQVGEAAERIAAELGTAPSVDLEGREAITGTAAQGDASQIGGVPTMAATSRQGVTGKDRNVAAADMMAVVADIPEEVTAAISEDPAAVQAQIDEGADPQVVAAVAALPQEALVSTQMENLLAGMEEGKTPVWARPAVAQVERMMASRGLSASTVGRDALFNAIIQSALPMAQSNAQALQQRAQQNLSNEQQANLASAQNTMTVRMQNLANRQTSASQTAQMAQEIKVQQGSFAQQASIATAAQEQQSKLATFSAARARAEQESAQRQQAAVAELSANAQMDLANLQALNAADADSMTAEQQSKLQTYNAQINKIMRTADLKQDMEKANLSNSLQIEMQRVSEMNAASKDTMTAEQTERLSNIQTLIDFRKTDAQFAQQMDMANMSNEQQIEMAMLQDKSATDTANFTADNQFRFQELNNVVERSARQAELNQRMEEVNLDSKLKVELSELAEKNTTSRANMSAEQQTRLANLNVLVDFRKTNAAMAQQMDLADLGNDQQMELANLQDRSATDAANFTEANRARTQELNTFVQVMSQNEGLKQNADMAKLSMQEKISLANLSSQSQADMASMSASNLAELQVYEKKMAAGQVNAQLAQQMGLANLSNEQSATMFNAQIDANMDMKQFDANQQIALSNSQFMKTVSLKDLDNRQQSAMQNATALASMDLANADALTRVSVENAKNFLAMDMANLSNRQQGVVLDQQLKQQQYLSEAAAKNAAKQFNATSQNQTDQFMVGVGQQMEQFNAAQSNAMEQSNAAEKNRMTAIREGNTLEADKITAQLALQAKTFNADMDAKSEQWNAANAQAVEQSNITWRRSSNTAATAAQNAANQQSASFEFNMTTADQANFWQDMRQSAQNDFASDETERDRIVNVINAALQNEELMTNAGLRSHRDQLFALLTKVTGG